MHKMKTRSNEERRDFATNPWHSFVSHAASYPPQVFLLCHRSQLRRWFSQEWHLVLCLSFPYEPANIHRTRLIHNKLFKEVPSSDITPKARIQCHTCFFHSFMNANCVKAKFSTLGSIKHFYTAPN